MITNLVSPLNVWSLDDGTLGGRLDDVANDLRTIKASVGQYGLELILLKCESYIIGGTEADRQTAERMLRPIFPEITIAVDADLCLLGFPITPVAIRQKLVAKSADFDCLCFDLNILPAHRAFFLLKYSLSILKLTYLLRTCSAWLESDVLVSIDTKQRRSLTSNVNMELLLLIVLFPLPSANLKASYLPFARR